MMSNVRRESNGTMSTDLFSAVFELVTTQSVCISDAFGISVYVCVHMRVFVSAWCSMVYVCVRTRVFVSAWCACVRVEMLPMTINEFVKKRIRN